MNSHLPSKVTMSFPADTAQLAKLGTFLRNHCASYPRSILIELAVTEVIVNAIKHGRAQACRVSLEQNDGCLKADIWNDGVAFDPAKAVPNAMGELRENGYGIAIIQELSSDIDYRFEQGWNKLGLTFERT